MLTHEQQKITKQLKQLKIVPVVSLPTVESGLALADILSECKLPVIEITFRTPCAVDAMLAIKKRHPDLLLLAGTVLHPEQVESAISSGASVIVSPGFTSKLAEYCKSKNILFCPGVCTPSEVQQAVEADLNLLKFFPSELAGGTKMLSLFQTIYQDVAFMPTGGISINNLESYFAFSNVHCCGGTWLAPQQLMIDKDWVEIQKRILNAMELIQ